MAPQQATHTSQDFLKLVGRKHVLQIISLLHSDGSKRYTALEEALETKSTSTLSRQLDELADAGIIERRRYSEMPPRVEYAITPKGRELIERLEPLLKWTAGDYTVGQND